MENKQLNNNLISVNKRSLAICVFLSIVTFGFYYVYWQCLLVKNTRAVNNNGKSYVGEVLCLLFVPFYSYYWWFTRGKTVKNEFSKRGYDAKSNGVLYLILAIFDLEIVSMALLQDDFNSLPSAYPKAVKSSSKELLKKLCLTAMMIAVSIVIGLVCKNFFTWNIYYRVTFENLPIIIIGYFFGPFYGLAAGALADVVSCLFSTNPAVNPIIMLGAATVGALAGLSRMVFGKTKMSFSLAVAVASAHIVGQVLIKSLGKILFFGMPPIGILIGLAISAVVGALEYFFIRTLLKNRYINKTLSDF